MTLKKIFVLLMLVIMILCNTVVYADEYVDYPVSGSCGDNVTWTLESNGTMTISGYGITSGYRPDHWLSYGNMPWKDYRTNIKNVVIEEGITVINSGFLSSLYALETVTIPKSVTEIRVTAFYGCDKLEDVYYAGSKQDWKNVYIDNGVNENENLLLAEMHYAEKTKYSDDGRYIVLVLDNSGSTEFKVNNQVIYTSNTAVSYVKEAAGKFIEETLSANDNSYVAIVSYSSQANIISDFDNDYYSLSKIVNSVSANQTSPDISSGLRVAGDLLNGVSGEKTIVLFTTGNSMAGSYDYYGHYNANTVAGTWTNLDTGKHYYAYGNVAYSLADKLKEDSTIYTVGLFQTMSSIPSSGKPIAEFFKLLTKDLASSTSHFYPVENPNDLNNIFENVANEIQNPSAAYFFDVNNISNPSTPKEGKANINKEQWTGDVFEFTAITSQNVNEISICGDKPDDTLWHEIPYSYLKENYGLSYVNNYDGTRTWTCQFGIHEIGYRAFMLRINGHETDFVTYATLYENNGNFSPTPQQSDISVVVNGKYVNFDVQPQIINGRTMVPVRAIFEALGAVVEWDEYEQLVTAEIYEPDGILFAQFIIGSNIMYSSCGSGEHIIDTPAMIINGRTLVPARAAAEAFDYNVSWDEATKTVYIYE